MQPQSHSLQLLVAEAGPAGGGPCRVACGCRGTPSLGSDPQSPLSSMSHSVWLANPRVQNMNSFQLEGGQEPRIQLGSFAGLVRPKGKDEPQNHPLPAISTAS